MNRRMMENLVFIKCVEMLQKYGKFERLSACAGDVWQPPVPNTVAVSYHVVLEFRQGVANASDLKTTQKQYIFFHFEERSILLANILLKIYRRGNVQHRLRHRRRHRLTPTNIA